MAKRKKKKNSVNSDSNNAPIYLEKRKPSKNIKRLRLALLFIFIGLAIISAIKNRFADNSAESSLHPSDIKEVPVKGMVTLLDLGADKCVPCKMMAPILEELEKAYKDKAAIVFIDVWKKPEYAKKFNIQAIPTQIFFDKDGKEVFRNTGFLDKKSIIEKMKQLGVSEPA